MYARAVASTRRRDWSRWLMPEKAAGRLPPMAQRCVPIDDIEKAKDIDAVVIWPTDTHAD